ncbi:hypothetical protein KFU94_44275 [Chloroflexi bacterium TSY]|nr:hypothetical protein [Chloroflexi bacterium TSY]
MINQSPTLPTVPANIAILWSEQTRQKNATEAVRMGATYTFTDAWGNAKTWLKGQHAYLAPSTVSAALNRFNLKYDFAGDGELAERLQHVDLLFLPSASQVTDADIAAIESWLSQDGKFLCVTGPTNLSVQLLGLESLELVQPDGYTAWQWREESPFGDRNKWEDWYISSFKGFTTCRVTPTENSTVLAEQLEITGDLTAPDTTTVNSLGAGIVKTEKTLFIVNALFEYLGGVWQAHLNSEDVRRWFNPVCWAETLLYQLRGVLWDCAQDRFWQTRLRTFGSYDGAMNIRHDPDASSDYTMLNYQGKHLIPATWTLLDEHFSPEATTVERDQGWVQEIAKYEFIEAGLHNDAIQESPPKWMMGSNLAHHVIESEKNLGIHLYTGGRHGGYSVYPEMIDAMDYLYQTVPHFLGLGTFHFHLMIEYGARTPGLIAGGNNVTWVTKTSPTIAGPGFWFPFRGVVATTEECRQLRGWDMTHEYDTGPELVDEIYERYNSKDNDPSTALPDGVYQFQYHPLFTVDPDYNNGRGTFDWMCYAIRRAERLNLWQATQKSIYERMQDVEDIQFMVETSAKIGAPETSGPDALGAGAMSEESMVDTAGYTSVRCGENYLAHIVQNRYFTLPPIEPEQSQTVQFELGAALHPFVAQANSKSLRLIDVQFSPEANELIIHVKVIRYQGLVVQGYAPESTVQVEIDGIKRQDIETKDGRVVFYLLGPENRFGDQVIRLSSGS